MDWLAKRRLEAQALAARGLPRRESGWLVVGTPLLFVLGLPAALWGWFALSPNAAVVDNPAMVGQAKAQAQHDADLRDEVRKCAIGLDEQKCKEAIYCADDPTACAYIMRGEAVDERQP